MQLFVWVLPAPPLHFCIHYTVLILEFRNILQGGARLRFQEISGQTWMQNLSDLGWPFQRRREYGGGRGEEECSPCPPLNAP